jgi:hypothetical protein
VSGRNDPLPPKSTLVTLPDKANAGILLICAGRFPALSWWEKIGASNGLTATAVVALGKCPLDFGRGYQIPGTVRYFA